jgi:cyclohexanone monooxygenase
MADDDVDVLVIGAGFAGLRALHTFRERGMRVAVLEAGADIGGVWYWNRYPGARCDVESYDYSYSFSPELEQEWRWSERYATQPEILAYLEHVAERFGLRRDIHCGERMRRAEFDEDRSAWTVTTSSGAEWRARFLVMATGQLSAAKTPELPGRDDFAGETYHTAAWPREHVDLSGKRVGVIGTGSSGMQLIPLVAGEAQHLTVFQRTPNYSVPADNAAITDEQDAEVKAAYRERRELARATPSGLGFVPNKTPALSVGSDERRATYEAAWGRVGFGFTLVYPDLLLDAEANETAAEFIRGKIAEKVTDPATRETLTPRGYPFGTKRPVVDAGYFETFNREDVCLVDIAADPIEKITPAGVATGTAEYPLDVLVFATGFDAMTGPLLRPEILGRGGEPLAEKWSAGPRSYLGLSAAGFPNLFVIAGPGSPSLLSNVVVSIEQHVDWLAGLLEHAEARGATEIEAETGAEQRWTAHVNSRAEDTLYPRARSYYMGDEVPGKPRVFMPYVGGVRGYRRICENVAAEGYSGFALR